jgi:acetyl/propionyl-CoA carboxylase alpha subunit
MHKLLVANRGEITLRIIRAAKAGGISSIALYTSSDALSPHVAHADAPQSNTVSESTTYLSAARILALCLAHQVTLLHGGYEFLSENAAFYQAAIHADITWLGPTPSVIKTVGLKHLVREVAMELDVICVPGSTPTKRRRWRLRRGLGIRLC